MNTISLLNPKGGVGKSTLCLNLATEYTRRGDRVAVLDCDHPQYTLFQWWENRPDDVPVIPVYTGQEKGDIRKTANALSTRDYDVLLIDGTGSIQEVVGHIIYHSDGIFIPITPSAADVWGVADLVDVLVDLEEERKTWFVTNRVTPGTVIAREFDFLLEREQYPIPLLDTEVRDRPATYTGGPFEGKGIPETDPDSTAHEEIQALADEIVDVMLESRKEVTHE